jgi:hypothetical protein
MCSTLKGRNVKQEDFISLCKLGVKVLSISADWRAHSIRRARCKCACIRLVTVRKAKRFLTSVYTNHQHEEQVAPLENICRNAVQRE